MKPMFGPLLFLGLMFFPGPALAQDEATIKGAFIMCGTQHVLIACDDLVQMPDLNNVVRSNAYGVRAATLLRLGRVEDAKRDLDEALRLNPDNQTVIDFKALLLEKGL